MVQLVEHRPYRCIDPNFIEIENLPQLKQLYKIEKTKLDIISDYLSEFWSLVPLFKRKWRYDTNLKYPSIQRKIKLIICAPSSPSLPHSTGSRDVVVFSCSRDSHFNNLFSRMCMPIWNARTGFGNHRCMSQCTHSSTVLLSLSRRVFPGIQYVIR